MDYWFQELPNQAKMPMPDRGLHLEGDAGWFSGSPPTTVLWVGAPGLWVGALAFSAPPLLATAPAGMGSARGVLACAPLADEGLPENGLEMLCSMCFAALGCA